MAEQAFNGTIKEGLERRYTIVKEKDFDKYCDHDDYMALNHILAKIERGRKKEGKNTHNSYVVVNLDEPYIEDIKAVMEANGHWG